MLPLKAMSNKVEVLAERFQTPMHLSMAREPISEFELTSGEYETFTGFVSAGRRQCWLRGRTALKRLLLRFGENEDTAALSFPNPRFSISHSGDLAIAVGAENDSLSGIGVDIELAHQPRMKSARFFCNAPEIEWLRQQPLARRRESLRRLWSIKEAAFKANPDNHGTGLHEYHVVLPDNDEGVVKFRHGPGIYYAGSGIDNGYFAVAVSIKETNHDF